MSTPRPVGHANRQAPRFFLALRDLLRLWKAVGRAEIVHVGLGGWPIPMGWFAGPMAKVRGRLLVVIVESADWRNPTKNLRMRLFNAINAWIAPKLARWADLAIYTQEQYRAEYPPRDPSLGRVIPASWIDEDVVLSDVEADAAWDGKPKDVLRLAFFGRLVEQKGVEILLNGLRRSLQTGTPVALDVYGAGRLEPLCAEAARQWPGRIQTRGELPYGPRFFEAVRQYHAVLVPNLGTEQARILYDANAQAVPVLGSSTDGNRQVITDGLNGWLTAVGDAEALALLIDKAAADIPTLRRMGLDGLRISRSHTHREMHRKRWLLLQELIKRKTQSTASRPSDDSN